MNQQRPRENSELSMYLVRHGQNKDNEQRILNGHRDEPLTEIGLTQAQTLADHLKQSGIGFDAIYTSPLVRASKTAEIIATTLGIAQPIEHPLLIERDFGVMTGHPTSDIEPMCSPNIIHTGTVTYFLDPEGAETFPDLMARARKVIDEISELQNRKGSVLLVCHGDIGKMIYATYYGLKWEDVLSFHFGNSEMLLLSQDTHPDHAHVFKQEQYNTH